MQFSCFWAHLMPMQTFNKFKVCAACVMRVQLCVNVSVCARISYYLNIFIAYIIVRHCLGGFYGI